METIAAFLSAITAIESPLKFWAFIAVVFLALAIAFFRSTALHNVWSKVVGKELKHNQRFRIIRLVVAGMLGMAVTALILAFAAPLLLRRMDIEQEAVQLNAQLATYAVMLDGTESESIQRDFASAMAAFKSQDYVTARRRMLSLQRQVASKQSLETLQGLITATYYARKEHTDGLEFICQQYRDKPVWDARFRYQIHAHVRRIAINEGYEDAERVVLSMRSRCRRADLSPVWAGISLGSIEHLVQDEEMSSADGPDRTFLQYAIERYPQDSMLDHALLALGQEEELLRRFPDSMLSRIALGSLALKRAEQDEHASTVEFAERYLARLMPDAATRNRSFLTSSVVDALGNAYLQLGRLEDARGLSDTWRDPAAQGVPGYVYVFVYKLIDNAADAAGIASALDQSVAAGYPAKSLPEVLPTFAPGTIPHIREGAFAEAARAQAAAQSVLVERRIPMPETWTTLSRNIDVLGARSQTMTAAQLLATGIAMRDQANEPDTRWELRPVIRAFSLGFWKHCETRAPQSLESMKAAYLRGAALRREGHFGDAASEFQALVTQHPQGYLADDALAELVSYYVQVLDNPEQAKKYLDRLTADYPSGNAVDNALYLLGDFYRNRQDYATAAHYYSAVAVNYSGRRLAIAANDMTAALEEVLNSSRKRMGVSGLRFGYDSDIEAAEAYTDVADVAPGSNAASAGFIAGDRVTHVAGREVTTVAQFYQALSQATPGAEVEVTVKRGFDEDVVILRTLVARESYYSKGLMVY